MTKQTRWSLLKRTPVYDSKFLKVYEDSVKLPNGTIIDDYTVVQKPSIVIIVATTDQNKLIVLDEYKHAAGTTLRTLPAGHKKSNESPVQAARRELLEETGFSGGRFRQIEILHDYPTKDLHRVYVVRAIGVKKVAQKKLEITEIISYKLITPAELKKQVARKEWKATSALAALGISGLLA